MSKRHRCKRHQPVRQHKTAGPGGFVFGFTLVSPAYEAGKAAVLAMIDRAPKCHEVCSMNAMMSFLLGAICPAAENREELKAMAVDVLPRLIECISIASHGPAMKASVVSPQPSKIPDSEMN